MKKLMIMLLVAILLTSLTGCEKKTEITEKKKIIKFAAQADNTPATQAVIDEFNLSQGIYEAQWVELPSDSRSMHDKLLSSLSEGSPEYDVLSMEVIWAGEFAGAGYLEPIDDKMQEKGFKQTDFNEGAMAAGNYKGKQYTLPFFVNLGLLYYRKDIVKDEEAKVLESGNYTYNDLSKLAEKYAEQGDTETGIVFQSDDYEGLTINVTEFTNSFHTIKRGLETMKTFVDADYTPSDILYYTENETHDDFIEGKTVFSRNWPYQYDIIQNDDSPIKEEQVGIAPLPNGGVVGGWLLGINKNAEDKDGAWELLRYLTSEDGQKIIATRGGHLPGYNDLLTHPDVVATNDILQLEGFKNALSNSIARPVSPEYEMVSDTIQLNVHKYLSGVQDIDSTVTELEKVISDNKIISEE